MDERVKEKIKKLLLETDRDFPIEILSRVFGVSALEIKGLAKEGYISTNGSISAPLEYVLEYRLHGKIR